jgi:hypothetical protein
MDHMQQFCKQKDYDTRITIPLATQEYSRGHGHLNLSKPSSLVISELFHPRGFHMILSHLTANSSLRFPPLFQS